MKHAADDRAQKTLASFVEVLGQKPYVTHTVRDLLWGYSNELLDLAKTLQKAEAVPEDKFYPYDQFGLWVGVSKKYFSSFFLVIYINYGKTQS